MIISVLNFCQKKVHRVFLVWTNINYEIMLTAHIIVPLIYWIFLSSELEESDARIYIFFFFFFFFFASHSFF